jgi:hypothetical protein
MGAITREILEERWRAATSDVARFAGERGISTVNSKRYLRLQGTIEELATLLVQEVYGERLVPDEPSEAERLDSLWCDLETILSDRMIAWALELEAHRAVRETVPA